MSRETYKRLDIGLLHGVLGHARAEDVNWALANGDTCFLKGFDIDKVSSGRPLSPIANHLKMIGRKSDFLLAV